MKKTLFSLLLGLFLAGSSAYAQIVATFDNHARFQSQYSGSYPSGINGSASMGLAANTYGSGNGSSFYWAQLGQYTVAAADFAAFNSATSFTLNLADAPGADGGGIHDFSLYASVVGLNTFVGNGVMAAVAQGGSPGTAAANWLSARSPGSGDAVFIGDFASGTSTISNAALDSLLSDNVFDGVGGDSSSEQIYIFAIAQAGSAGNFDGVTLGGTITAVPEPATYALLAGALTFGCILIRRRKRD